MTQTVSKRDDGLMQIHNGEFVFTVCIPSRGRARRVVKNPFFPIANLFVAEDEVDAYAREFAEMEVTPGSLNPHYADGHIPRIRNTMLDAMRPGDEGFQVQLDDDYAGMMRLFTLRSRQSKITDPQHIIDIFTHSYIVARDFGTGLFFYAQTPTPYERHSWLPFRLRGWGMGATMGFLQPKEVRFDEGLILKEDIDVCLMNIAVNKVGLQDMRFWGWCDESGGRAGTDVGGLASIRLTDTELGAVRYLQAKWGKKVISENGKQRGSGTSVRVAIPQRYEGGK